jgi:glycosyltransferase involved in cell wall biosynthesis
VISTDNPGGLELNGVFGPDVGIVPGGQPIALGKAILAFLHDKRRTMSATRDVIERDFRPAAVAAQYWRIYEDLAGSRT